MTAGHFADRADAGRRLAAKLAESASGPDVVVLGLPRGGVPVAFEVARALGSPLDVFVVRKLGVPGHGELAMGAVAAGGVRVLNPDVISRLGVSQDDVDRITEAELEVVERREADYRASRPPLVIEGKTVLVVDDGLATGATMRAAVAALRLLRPTAVVVAVPVAAASTCAEMETVADQVVCAVTPYPFFAVGSWYDDFGQTTDAEVRRLLDDAAQRFPPA